MAREVLISLDRMAADGHIEPPEVLLPSKGAVIAPPQLDGVRVRRVGRLKGHLWEQLELPFYCSNSTLLCLGNTAPLMRLRKNGERTVTMVHDLSYLYFPQAYSRSFRALYGFVIPRVLAQSSKVVTVSNAELKAIQERFPEFEASDRFSYLQNGGFSDNINRKTETETTPNKATRTYGLYVGSLTRRKNAEGVISGALAFLERYPEMEFRIIGAQASSFRQLEIHVPEKLKDRIEFCGQINDVSVIREAYRGARFLLFPSFYEASPLPPVEAMTMGCPVISSDIASLKERCGDAAYYCDPARPESISSAINAIMEDDTLWQRLSEAGIKRAKEFTWEAQAQGLLRLSGVAI